MLTYRNVGLVEYISTLTIIKSILPSELQHHLLFDENIFEIKYPILWYPLKVHPANLDKTRAVSGILQGIKGQYLLFDHENVINIRSHTGYRVNITIS